MWVVQWVKLLRCHGWNYHPELRRRRENAEAGLEVAMPTVGNRRGGRTLRRVALGLMALTASGVGPSRAEDCKYFSALPDDCARAALRKFDGLRDYRYEEIELFAKDPLKKVLYVTVYDTTGLNGGEDSRDSAPGGACAKSGSEEDRQTISGALGAG